MVTLRIRNVPASVQDKLVSRARDGGRSLQALLLDLVVREASFADVAPEASFADNLALIRELDARSSRDGAPHGTSGDPTATSA